MLLVYYIKFQIFFTTSRLVLFADHCSMISVLRVLDFVIQVIVHYTYPPITVRLLLVKGYLYAPCFWNLLFKVVLFISYLPITVGLLFY